MALQDEKRERKQAKALAQARRDQLLDEYGAKKNKKAYIGLVESIIRDEDLAILYSGCIEHFFACEGDPDILHVEYAPPPISVCIESIKRNVRYNAIVRYFDNRVEYRNVKLDEQEEDERSYELEERAANELGGSFLLVTSEWLEKHGQRIANWKRALAAHRICRRTPIGQYKKFLTTYVEQHGTCTFGELLAQYSKQNRPHVLGAIVELVGEHVLRSDLDTQVWGLLCTVSIQEYVS